MSIIRRVGAEYGLWDPWDGEAPTIASGASINQLQQMYKTIYSKRTISGMAQPDRYLTDDLVAKVAQFTPEPVGRAYYDVCAIAVDNIINECIRRLRDKEPRLERVLLNYEQFRNAVMHLHKQGGIMIDDDDTFIYHSPTGPVKVGPLR